MGAAGGRGVTRRSVLVGALAAALAPVAAACASEFAAVRLVIATGGPTGVYIQLGRSLARVWQQRLRLRTDPDVRQTAGSVENLAMLADGRADVVISQIDTAAEAYRADPGGPRSPRALARIYDDALHVVVPADSPIRTITDLRGQRVSIGGRDSGVEVIARRVLEAAGLAVTDLQAQNLGLQGSVAAMGAGALDAFFWSGALETPNVTDLSEQMAIRLLDLDADGTLTRVRELYPVYAPGTVPALTYEILEPVTTLSVRNFLLVPAEMDVRLAHELIEAVFDEQPEIARTVAAALRIDPRAAIGTQPVPLHRGAEEFFQDEKS